MIRSPFSRRISRSLPLGLVAVLAACQAVGPDFEGAPATTAAEVSSFPSLATAAKQEAGAKPGFRTDEPAAAWWEAVRDPELDALIADARAANFDLRIAEERIRLAGSVLRQARAPLSPRSTAWLCRASGVSDSTRWTGPATS